MAGLAVVMGWLLGFSGILGVILLLVGLVRWATGGDPRAALLWGFTFLAVAAGGYGAVRWFLGGPQPGVGGRAGFIVVPADSGPRPFEAARYFPVEVTVIPTWTGFDYYIVMVDWGDGSASSWPHGYPYGDSGEPACLRHAYHDTGLYTVRVEIVYYTPGGGNAEEGHSVTRSFTVNVTAPWYQYSEAVKSYIAGIPEEGNFVERAVAKALKWTGSRLADAFAAVVDMMARWMSSLGLDAGYAYYYYVAMPTGDNFPPLDGVYSEVEGWALYLFPAAVVASLLWRGFWEWERGSDALLDTLRDALAVAIGIYVALDAYDALANIFNTITLSIAQLGQLGALYAMVLSSAVVLSVVGMFASSAGALGASIFVMVLVMVLVGALKWLLAAAIVAALPLLLVLWLVPPLRGAAQTALELLAGLFVFSLVAAVLSALVSRMALTLTEISEGHSLLFALVVPLIFAAATPLLTHTVASSLGWAPSLPLLRGAALAPAAPGALAAAAAAATAEGVRGSPTLPLAAARPPSGTVLGVAPAPVPAARPAARPLIVERPITPASRIREWLDVARGKTTVLPLKPREKLAYHTARAASALAARIHREARAFEAELARRLGLTPLRAAQRAAKAAYHTGRLAVEAARWVVPRITGASALLKGEHQIVAVAAHNVRKKR